MGGYYRVVTDSKILSELMVHLPRARYCRYCGREVILRFLNDRVGVSYDENTGKPTYWYDIAALCPFAAGYGMFSDSNHYHFEEPLVLDHKIDIQGISRLVSIDSLKKGIIEGIMESA